MRRLVEAVAAAAAVALLAGCGGSDYSSPTATFNTMWEATKAGNKDAVMACYSEATRKKMAEAEKALAEMPGMAARREGFSDKMLEQAKKVKVETGAEKIEGDKATLEVTTDGHKLTYHFVKEADGWKLGPLGAAAMDMDVGKMKEAMEMMMKKMPKGMMEGLQKGRE